MFFASCEGSNGEGFARDFFTLKLAVQRKKDVAPEVVLVGGPSYRSRFISSTMDRLYWVALPISACRFQVRLLDGAGGPQDLHSLSPVPRLR